MGHLEICGKYIIYNILDTVLSFTGLPGLLYNDEGLYSCGTSFCQGSLLAGVNLQEQQLLWGSTGYQMGTRLTRHPYASVLWLEIDRKIETGLSPKSMVPDFWHIPKWGHIFTKVFRNSRYKLPICHAFPRCLTICGIIGFSFEDRGIVSQARAGDHLNHGNHGDHGCWLAMAGS